MNPLSRIAPVTDAEAAQMVHPDTLADLAERLTSTPVEAAAAEDAAGNAARQSPRRSRGWHAAGLVRRGPGPRRWPGWLAPVAAAVAVTGVIIASLGISGLILRPAETGPAHLPAAPRQFNPLIPNVSFGWLPAGESLLQGGVRRTEVYLSAGRPPNDDEWALDVYARGRCHLTGPATGLTCSTRDLRGASTWQLSRH